MSWASKYQHANVLQPFWFHPCPYTQVNERIVKVFSSLNWQIPQWHPFLTRLETSLCIPLVHVQSVEVYGLRELADIPLCYRFQLRGWFPSYHMPMRLLNPRASTIVLQELIPNLLRKTKRSIKLYVFLQPDQKNHLTTTARQKIASSVLKVLKPTVLKTWGSLLARFLQGISQGFLLRRWILWREDISSAESYTIWYTLTILRRRWLMWEVLCMSLELG